MSGIYSKLSARLKQAAPQAVYLKELISIIWSPARGTIVAWLAMLSLAAMLPVASILLSKQLVDRVILAMKTGLSPESTRELLVLAGLMASIAVLMEVLNGIVDWIRTAQTEKILDRVSELIQQKSVSIDYAFYESPEFHDRLYRARDEAKNKIPTLLEHFGSVYQNGLTLIALSTIIALYNGVLLLALALSFLPAFFVIARFNWLTHQWWAKTTAERRWLNYYDQKFADPTSAAEIRLLQLGPRFQAAYGAIRNKIRTVHLALIARQTFTRGGAAVVGIVVAGFPVGWMAWRAMLGKATFGDIVVFYQAFLGGQGFVKIMTVGMAQIYSNSLYLTNLCEYLALQPLIKDPSIPLDRPVLLKEAIQFRDVSFRYPGSDRVALNNLSLTIPAGKIVAIVGPNGAGKSTLIKLLCRFYDPAEGSITIDQAPLRAFAVKDVRSFFSILFQRPVSYDATAAENISMGDINAQPSISRILDAATRAGANELIDGLPQGYHTLLGKCFANGSELSAGEWQRVSMARAFFRRAAVTLLDEPTSFMDPWSEAAWFDRLRDLNRERTAVVVTHRFTIAMRADLIHVMQEGRVVESGTHFQLLRNNGLYAQSWREQVSAVESRDSERVPSAATAS